MLVRIFLGNFFTWQNEEKEGKQSKVRKRCLYNVFPSFPDYWPEGQSPRGLTEQETESVSSS